MPSLQVVDTTLNQTPNRAEENLKTFFSKMGKDYQDKRDKDEIGNLIGQYQQNRQDANAWEDLQLGLEKSNVSPTKRLETQKSLNEMRKVITEKDKALNKQASKNVLSAEDRQKQKDNLKARAYTDEEAEAYLDAPPSVKNVIEKHVTSEVERKIRKLPGQSQEQQQTSDQDKTTETPQTRKESELDQVSEAPEEAEWPELPPPSNMLPAETVKWQNSNEKTNIKKLEEVEKKKKGYRDNKILINSMTKANDSEKLPSDLGRLVLVDPETGDIRPTAQLAGAINPETELYIKNLKQFLKGAKDFFGARVTDFDVSSFMAQLPSLMNSDQGRRMILKQMELVNELESIHTNELDEGIKHYGRNANYIDISKTVDNKVAKREESTLKKIDQVVEASNFLNKMNKNKEKFRDSVLMMTPEGEFKAVKKDLVPKYQGEKKWIVY